VNFAGKVIGMIPKNFIIVLIEQHQWYEHQEIEFTQPLLYRSVSLRSSTTNKKSKNNKSLFVDEDEIYSDNKVSADDIK